MIVLRRIRIRPRRLAAVAAQYTDQQLAERAERARLPEEIDAMCRDWGVWCATRRIAAPRPLGSVLGRLRMPGSGRAGEGPHVRLDADIAAFHLALQMQSERNMAVLWGLYALPAIEHRRVPVKLVADALHISRQHVYRVRDEAARSAYAHRHAVLQAQAAMLAAARSPEPARD